MEKPMFLTFQSERGRRRLRTKAILSRDEAKTSPEGLLAKDRRLLGSLCCGMILGEKDRRREEGSRAFKGSRVFRASGCFRLDRLRLPRSGSVN